MLSLPGKVLCCMCNSFVLFYVLGFLIQALIAQKNPSDDWGYFLTPRDHFNLIALSALAALFVGWIFFACVRSRLQRNAQQTYVRIRDPALSEATDVQV